MKKLVVGTLTCVTLLAASAISFAVTGRINTDTARVRSEASATSKIIDLLSIDDKVEIVEESGDWYKIKVSDKTGYVSKSLLDVEGTVAKAETNSNESNKDVNQSEEKTTTEENNEQVEQTEKTDSEKETEDSNQEETSTEPAENDVKITENFTGKLGSEVTIKILPSINSIDIAKIEKGAEIKVIEIINDWCHIETNIYSGWVRIQTVKEALSVETEETATPEQEEKTDEEATTKEEEKNETKTGYVNVETVNLRKENNTSSEKLDSIKINTKVTIISEEDGWYKVKVNDLTGYISKKYISNKKVEEVTSRASDTARQISENKSTENNSKANEVANTTPATTAGSSKGTEVVAFAKQYLGYKYVAGGSSPSTGFDCSGFTSYVYKNFGVSINRTSSGQRSNGVAVDKSNLQAGDIVCFNGHVGLYIGNNQFIHASNPKGGVKINSLSDSYYVKNYITSRRVLN